MVFLNFVLSINTLKMKKLILLTLMALSMVGHAKTPFSQMKNDKPYTVLVLMNATPQWLSLSRDDRSKFFEKELLPIFGKVSQTVDVQLFDSEYFHATVSDFLIISTTELDDYKLLIEMLRDTKVYGVPYFEIVDIIVGQEEMFQDFNEKLKK